MKPRTKRTVKIAQWEEYVFKLYIPSVRTNNNKPYVQFYQQDDNANSRTRIRVYKGLGKDLSHKQLKENSKTITSRIIERLQAGLEPVETGDDQTDHIYLTAASYISDCLNHWLAYRKECLESGGIRPKGFASSRHIHSYLLEWLAGKKYLLRKASSINKFDVELFLQVYATKRSWNKVSYNTYRGHLITFFNYLVGLKVITENPAKITKKQNIRNDHSRFVIYEERELKHVVSILKSDSCFHDLYIAAQLVYRYNIRPIELLRLQVRDIDFEKRLLMLPAGKTKNGNDALFALDDECTSLMAGLIGDAPGDFYIFGSRRRVSRFPTFDGYLEQRWRAFRKAHHIAKHLKFYALKHSSNYYDLQDGASFEEIRQRNRHSNLQVTSLYIKERLFKSVIKGSLSNRFSV